MDSELKKTLQHTAVQHTPVQHTPVQNAAEGYKSNQQLKCTRTQRDIKQATGPRIQYRSVNFSTMSDTVTLLEQKCESLQDRIASLELKAQNSRDGTLNDDKTEDTISDCESYFEFINSEAETENDQTGQEHADDRSYNDSSTSSHKEKKLPDTFEERLSKNDTKVTKIKARIAKLLCDIDDVVREMKETHEDINSQLRQARDNIVSGPKRFN